MSGLIESIRKDREVGTPGPWFHSLSRSSDVRAGHPESGMRIAQFAHLANPASPDRFYEFCANAARAARVPDMEAALLAAEELASCVSSLDDPKNEEQANEIYGAMLTALRRYREATS